MATNENNFVVKVIEYSTEKIVSVSKPMPERKADIVDRGMNRNLDNEKFFTVIESIKSSPALP
jgi:hypothetical protein